MYSDLQEAIKDYLEADDYFGAGSVILEDQPGTPDEWQRRLNSVGWGLLIGKPVVRREFPFQVVLFPMAADENQRKNRADDGDNKLPDEVILTAENLLRNYQPDEIWTPLRLTGDVKQLFPDNSDGKIPWSFVIMTKTVPVVLDSAKNELGDIIVFEDDSEMTLTAGPGL